MLMELDRAWELSTDFRTRSRAGQHSALSMGQTWLVPGGTGLPQWQHGTEKWWVCSRIQKHTWKKYSPGQSFSATQFPALPSQGKENANSAAQDLVASDPSSRHIHPSTFSHFLSSINSYFTGFALPTSLIYFFLNLPSVNTSFIILCISQVNDCHPHSLPPYICCRLQFGHIFRCPFEGCLKTLITSVSPSLR